MEGTLISTFLVPLHQKYCISQHSTIRTRMIFYLTLLFTGLLLLHPIPSLLSPLLPMSKPLWTPPFLIQTTGMTLLSWLLASIIDIYPTIQGTQFLEAMGRREFRSLFGGGNSSRIRNVSWKTTCRGSMGDCDYCG